MRRFFYRIVYKVFHMSGTLIDHLQYLFLRSLSENQHQILKGITITNSKITNLFKTYHHY